MAVGVYSDHVKGLREGCVAVGLYLWPFIVALEREYHRRERLTNSKVVICTSKGKSKWPNMI